MPSLMIIDGNSIINRAFFGLGQGGRLTAPDGTPTGAVYTFLNMFLRYFNEYQPTHICIAFDRPEPTFRHKRYEDYKATRKGMPEELAVQMPILKSCLEALRIYNVEKAGYEADDIIGTFAARYGSKELPVYILSGDRDDFQLLNENVTQIYPQNRGETTVYTPELVFEKMGVRPDQVVDLKALMGDSSDNIPGVKGVGEKTAVKLLQEFDTLESVLANLEEIKGSVAAKLRDGVENARLSRELARIDTDVPLEVDLTDLVLQEWDRPKLLQQFRSLGFQTMINRFGLDQVAEEDASEADSNGDWELKQISFEESLPEGKLSRLAVVLLEGEGENKRLLLAGMAEKPELRLFPEADSKQITAYLAKLIGQNHTLLAYDWKMLFKQLDFYPAEQTFDISVAAYLAGFDSDAKTLAEVYSQVLGRAMTEASVPSGSLDTTLIEAILPACQTALAQLEAAQVLEDILRERKLLDLAKQVEFPLIAILAGMEKRGVRVEAEILAELGREFNIQAAELEQNIFAAVGHSFNINSPKQLGVVLFEELGISKGRKTATGAYSTAASELEKLAPFYPVIQDVLAYRRVTKLDSTFIQGLTKEIQADGRIHTTYHQTLTATGRLSSSDPNLQNIPMREAEGRQIRRAFLPAEGYVFLDADYSQIELRLLAVLSGDADLLDAFARNQDIHTRTAASIFGIPESEVRPEQRAAAKTVNFSIVYGISDFGLAQDLQISRQEAHQYIEGYHSQYESVKPYMEGLVDFGRDHGYVETYFGRRRYIAELESKNGNVRKFGERAAMNAPVQGTAADIMKIAMIRTQEALDAAGLDAKILLQVHDELLLEVRSDQATQASEILQQAMEGAADLPIPLVAEVKAGNNWYECK